MKKPQPLIEIRTYQFKHGLLHLERVEAERMTTEDIAERYASAGPLQAEWDDEMPADQFFQLEDFLDL